MLNINIIKLCYLHSYPLLVISINFSVVMALVYIGYDDAKI